MRTYKGMPDIEDKPDMIENPDKVEQGVSFPEEYVESFRGLLFLGALEQEVEYGGHTFLIKTLKEGDNLRIGQLTGEYKGTPSEFIARRLYTVAACVDYVDGREVLSKYKKGEDVIYEKAQIVKQWYPAVIAYVYEKYVELETAAIEIANALKK